MKWNFGILLYLFACRFSEVNSGNYCDSSCGLVALVPARGGSKGLKNKNLSILNGQTLIYRTVSVIKSSNAFKDVWVSTDSDVIAQEAEKAGAKVHWRVPETGADNATTVSVVQDFLSVHTGVQTVAVVQCTSPFLCDAWLRAAASLMEHKDCPCVFAVSRNFKLRWNQKQDGSVVPANFNPEHRPRRQDWPGELYETGMFYFTMRSLVEEGSLQNDRCKVVEVLAARSHEIDTISDLEAARAILPFLTPCPDNV